MSARGAKRKQKTLSRSARAGVLFPVARIHRYLKKDPRHLRHRIGAGSPVYMAAVIEYLVAEILELAGNAAKEFKKSRIIPRHILLAIANDEELHQLLRHVTIAQGGVVQKINPFLIGPRNKANKAVAAAAAALASSTTKASTKLAAKKLKASILASTSPSKAVTLSSKGSLKRGDSTASGGGQLTLSEKKLANGQKLTVLQGDMMKVNVDAIVHPTNSNYSFGGEVGSAMQRAGGKEFQQEVDKLLKEAGSMPPAGAAICPGHKFPAKFVIHVNSPNWTDTNAQKNLDKAVKNVLKVADDKNLKTVALPSISSGNAGFPKQTAAQIILASIRDYFSSAKSTTLKHIFFVLYDLESVGVYTTELARLDG